MARERVVDVFFVLWERFSACRALSRVDALPSVGGRRFTPDRRAFESPMAMACSVERAPCIPRRM